MAPRDLLELGRRRRTQEPVSCAELLSAACAMLRHASGDNAAVLRQLREVIDVVGQEAHSPEMRQVLRRHVCRSEAESRCVEGVASPSPCRRGVSDASCAAAASGQDTCARCGARSSTCTCADHSDRCGDRRDAVRRAERGCAGRRADARADAGGGNGRGQGARRAGGAAAAVASGSAACRCAASGRAASAPGAAAARPGRGRDCDRRGGRRWGERSAVAGSCGSSSDAAAGAVGRGPGACGSVERAHPVREEASRAAILSRGVTVSRC